MLEFVFFNTLPCDRFVAFLQRHNVNVVRQDQEEALSVAIAEDTDDKLLETIEAQYDELMDLDRSLFEAADDGASDQAAGVVVNLASGESVYAAVDIDLVNRIMQVLTPAQFGKVVDAIVDAVEHPDRRPLCKRTDQGNGG